MSVNGEQFNRKNAVSKLTDFRGSALLQRLPPRCQTQIALAVRMASPATTDLTARADTVYVERTVRDTVVRVLPATTPLTAGADPENTSTTTGKTSTTTGKTSTTTGKTSTTIEIPIAATGISIAATGKTGTTLAKPAGDSRPTDTDGLEGLLPVVPLGADFAPAGRSMRDDGVDYSLIVSL